MTRLYYNSTLYDNWNNVRKKTITALFHVKTELHTYVHHAHAAVPIIILSMAKVQLNL